jgi:hypothetical protein
MRSGTIRQKTKAISKAKFERGAPYGTRTRVFAVRVRVADIR